MMDMGSVLMELSAACGVCGDEAEAVETAAKYLAPLVDTVRISPTGNLVGIRKCGRARARTVLLDAHLDEVGLLVTGQEDGLLKISGGVGGVDSRLLPGLVVKVLTEPAISGVVSVPEKPEDTQKPFELDDLRIDCGLSRKAAAQVPVGTRVAYGTQPWRAGMDRICGKSLDNRACFTALLRALELTQGERLPVHVAVLGSVQEERGGLGALTGAFDLEPDVALVVDVTFGDSPDTLKERGLPLGSGAAIGYSPVLDRDGTRRLRRLAEQAGISHTLEVMERGTGTNSMHTQIAGKGVPSLLISLPLRYMHTPAEEISLRDVEAVARLTAEFLRNCREVQP